MPEEIRRQQKKDTRAFSTGFYLPEVAMAKKIRVQKPSLGEGQSGGFLGNKEMCLSTASTGILLLLIKTAEQNQSC